MNKLIYADDLKKALIELGFFPAIVKNAIEKAPEVDAELVRHARWKAFETGIYRLDKDGLCVNYVPKKYYRCTFCGKGTVVKTEYCTCGAKMDKKDPAQQGEEEETP